MTPSDSARSSEQNQSIDADLWRVAEAWRDLPEPVRAGIIAMVEAAKQ